MNRLITIKDDSEMLRIHGNFGSGKMVNINNFGGITYIHVKTPKKSGSGWKHFTMTMREYGELIRMVGPQQIEAITENFDNQNRNLQIRAEAARKAAAAAEIQQELDRPIPTPSTSGEEEPIPERKRARVAEE